MNLVKILNRSSELFCSLQLKREKINQHTVMYKKNLHAAQMVKKGLAYGFIIKWNSHGYMLSLGHAEGVLELFSSRYPTPESRGAQF